MTNGNNKIVNGNHIEAINLAAKLYVLTGLSSVISAVEEELATRPVIIGSASSTVEGAIWLEDDT